MHSYMLKQLFSRKTLSIMREPVHTHIFQKKKNSHSLPHGVASLTVLTPKNSDEKFIEKVRSRLFYNKLYIIVDLRNCSPVDN